MHDSTWLLSRIWKWLHLPSLLSLLFHILRPFNYPLSERVSRLLPTLLALIWTHFRFCFILMMLNLEKAPPPFLSWLQVGGRGSLPQVPGVGIQEKGMPLSILEDDWCSVHSLIHSFWLILLHSNIYGVLIKCLKLFKNKGCRCLWPQRTYILPGETDYGKETNKETTYFQVVISAITIVIKQGKRIEM